MEEEKLTISRKDLDKLIEERSGNSQGLDLSGKRFAVNDDYSKLDLIGIILDNAKLSECKLQEVNFTLAHLKGANLERAHLEGAKLTNADLEGADLLGSYLTNADLKFTRLKGTYLIEANLKLANLKYAQLQDADLMNANIEGADLMFANLKGANLKGCKIRWARLEGVELSFKTILEGVDWGDMVGEEVLKDYESAERVYRILEKWHEEHGIRDLASDFAYKKQRARRKAIGAETRQKFKEAFKWRG